jgi:hypothetical protein
VVGLSVVVIPAVSSGEPQALTSNVNTIDRTTTLRIPNRVRLVGCIRFMGVAG